MHFVQSFFLSRLGFSRILPRWRLKFIYCKLTRVTTKYARTTLLPQEITECFSICSTVVILKRDECYKDCILDSRYCKCHSVTKHAWVARLYPSNFGNSQTLEDKSTSRFPPLTGARLRTDPAIQNTCFAETLSQLDTVRRKMQISNSLHQLVQRPVFPGDADTRPAIVGLKDVQCW